MTNIFGYLTSSLSRIPYRTIRDAGLFFLLLAVIWEAAVRIFKIKSYLLPTPTEIIKEMFQSSPLLWQHSLVTLNEVLLGFVAAMVFGLLIALAVFFIPLFRRTLYPLVIAMQGVPKVALAPLIIVWFGYGVSSKVIMAFLFAFFPVVISTLGGLATTPAHLIEHFRALKMSAWDTFWKLRVPSALPNFIDGCKVAMPLAVIGAVVGEFVGSSDGLGNLILLASGSSRTALMFATLFAITFLSLLLYLIVELCGSFVWWRAR
ncbi:MAG: ABC transporter permease [marine bacterium B5-7]|nr:MAG: ABC transporter permease [marine bacterium B5-7]